MSRSRRFSAVFRMARWAAAILLASACGNGPTPLTLGMAPSRGCGTSGQPTGSVMARSITVGGTSRTYALTVPQTYAPTVPSALIFGYHGAGGTGAGISVSLQLETEAGSPAIFVYPDGVGGGWDPNETGADVQMFDAVAAAIEGSYCIDRNRVFATGFSFGGSMTNSIGCFRGGAVRAIAPMAGGIIFSPADAPCRGPIPVWLAYGSTDPSLPQYGYANRDFWIQRNRCSTSSTPVDPSPCVGYLGCDPAGSLTYCEWAGGHDIPPFGPRAIRGFFDKFD